MMAQYAYAIVDNHGKLAVFDYRVHVFWHKKMAVDDCPEGFYVKRVSISTGENK